MTLKQLFKNIRSRLKRLILTYKTVTSKLINGSDYNRWRNKDSFYQNWNERTKILGEFIEPNTRIFEFGAGQLYLKRIIPENCEYFHSDLVKRADDTLVLDLNKKLPDIPEVDFVVFSGVLEYINDVEELLCHLVNKTQYFLFSYATLDKFELVKFRRSQGWISDLRHQDFERIAVNINASIEVVDEWNNQTLYKFTKC